MGLRRPALALLLLIAAPRGAWSGETIQELADRLLTDYSRLTNPNLAIAQTAAAQTGCRAEYEPNAVQTQIGVTKFGAVDEQLGTYEIEGFFRLWWNDPRLVWDARRTCIEELQLLDGPTKIWVPDFYFPDAKEYRIGFDQRSTRLESGQQLTIQPNGDVYWSQRLAMTVNCDMDYSQLPWDSQECGLRQGIGSYSQGGDQVAFSWRDGADALDQLEEHSDDNPEWEIGPQTQDQSPAVVRASGAVVTAKVRVSFTLSRIPGKYYEDMYEMLMFVVISYLGCWMDRRAAPARVTLSTVAVLVATTKHNALGRTLPVAREIWLVDFQFGCLMFNVFGFIIYALVNFGMQQDNHLQKLRKEAQAAKTKQGQLASAPPSSDDAGSPVATSSNPLSTALSRESSLQEDGDGRLRRTIQSESDDGDHSSAAVLKTATSSAWNFGRDKRRQESAMLVNTSKLKHLDLPMRWMFPVVFCMWLIYMFVLIDSYGEGR